MNMLWEYTEHCRWEFDKVLIWTNVCCTCLYQPSMLHDTHEYCMKNNFTCTVNKNSPNFLTTENFWFSKENVFN